MSLVCFIQAVDNQVSQLLFHLPESDMIKCGIIGPLPKLGPLLSCLPSSQHQCTRCLCLHLAGHPNLHFVPQVQVSLLK